MRTAEEYRKRQVDMLPLALQRPGMFCADAGDLFYGNLLRDLVWLDERPMSETEAAFLLVSGSAGVFGKLWEQKHKCPDQYENEVASSFAEAAFRLGYFTPERLLTAGEFGDLHVALDVGFFAQDHTQSEMVTRFGNPSHEVVGGQTDVHCYGCVNPQVDWIYFDYSRCYPPKDRVTYKWFDDPILRDVRRSRNKFELLPFAQWFREGEGNVESG